MRSSTDIWEELMRSLVYIGQGLACVSSVPREDSTSISGKIWERLKRKPADNGGLSSRVSVDILEEIWRSCGPWGLVS